MRNRLVEDSILILATNGITYFTTLVSNRLVSSCYSFGDFGTRAQFLSVVSIVLSVISIGLANCPSYFIPLAEGKDSAEKISRNLYFVAIVVLAPFVFILPVMFDNVIKYFNNPKLVDYKLLLWIMVAEQFLYSFYSGIQIAKHKAIKNALLNLLRAILSVTCTYVICSQGLPILYNVLGSAVLDFGFCVFSVWDSTHPLMHIGRWLDVRLIRNMLGYCLPLGVSSVTASLCTQIDKLFVGGLYSETEYALYANLCTELPLAAVSGAFIAIISPYVVKMVNLGKQQEAIKLWGYVIVLVAIILFPVISILIVYSKQAVLILFSEKYVIGYKLFCVFSLMEVFRITYFGLILKAYGKSWIILSCSALTLILDVLLNTLSYFVFQAGLLGFAISTFCSTLIIQLLQLVMSSRISGVGFCQIFPWVELMRVSLINLAFALGFSMLSSSLNWDYYDILPVSCIVAVWIVGYVILNIKKISRLYFIIRDTKI